MLSKLILKIFCFIFLFLNSNILPFEYGEAHMQGIRPTMEDAFCINPKEGFFSLFDGHGGDFVANFAAENLCRNIVNDSKFKNEKEIHEAIKNGFLKTHKEIPGVYNLKDTSYIGTTAVAAIFKNEKIYVANVGDSRAVISSNEQAIALSIDHKPTLAGEKERIETNGGSITNWWGPNKVYKPGCRYVLAVSRAIGDKCLYPLVIPDPEIVEHSLTMQDDFLILACDGVWDVISNQGAVDIVAKSLEQNNNNFEKAAKDLIQSAYDKGSTDNISAIVINLMNVERRRLKKREKQKEQIKFKIFDDQVANLGQIDQALLLELETLT